MRSDAAVPAGHQHCIHGLKHQYPQLQPLLNRRAEQLAVSTVVLTELHFGAENSARPEQNLAVIESFTARLDVIDFDASAGAHSGQIRAALQRAGQLIGPYDLLIAGHARSAGLIRVTNYLAKFTRVPGLMTENWW